MAPRGPSRSSSACERHGPHALLGTCRCPEAPVTLINPLHWQATDPDVLWSGGNVSEAIPGVSTALNWSFVGDALELSARQGFASLGILARDEVVLTDR